MRVGVNYVNRAKPGIQRCLTHSTTPGHIYTMDNLGVSLDAATLDTAAGKEKVQSIDQDGSLVYEQKWVFC